LKKELNFKGNLYVVDASKISKEKIGKDIPNIPILGAVSKLYPVLKVQSIREEIKAKFTHKLGELGTKKNIEALETGFKEVM